MHYNGNNGSPGWVALPVLNVVGRGHAMTGSNRRRMWRRIAVGAIRTSIQRMDAPMSRDERPSRLESASGLESARQGTGFESTPECEEIRFGCSMLSQIRLRSHNPRTLAPMRCSLGYALHSDDDIARCRAVEGPGDCWKAAPSWRVAAPGPEPRAKERTRHPNGVTADTSQLTVETTEVVVELVEIRVTTGTATADDN